MAELSSDSGDLSDGSNGPRDTPESSTPQPVPLRTLASRSSAEVKALFSKLLSDVSPELQDLLLADSTNLKSLAGIVALGDQPSEISLIASRVLCYLKKEDQSDDPRLVDSMLLNALRQEKGPLTKHHLSLALQESTEPVTSNLIELLKDPTLGDYASVALRGTASETLDSLIVSELRKGDKDSPIAGRCISALMGCSEQRLRHIDNLVAPPEEGLLSKSAALLSFHQTETDPTLQQEAISLTRTIPFSRDVVFHNSEEVAALGLLQEDPPRIFACSRKVADSSSQFQKLILGEPDNPYRSGVLDSLPSNLSLLHAAMKSVLLNQMNRQTEEAIRERLRPVIPDTFVDDTEDRKELNRLLDTLSDIPVSLETLQQSEPKNFILSSSATILPSMFHDDEASSLRASNLLQMILDSNLMRATRFSAGVVLKAVAAPSDIKEPLEKFFVRILKGQNDAAAKHAAALGLQGTSNQQALEALCPLLDDPQAGDFAAVAMRGNNSPTISGKLGRAIQSNDPRLVKRAALASLCSSDQELGKTIQAEHLMRKNLDIEDEALLALSLAVAFLGQEQNPGSRKFTQTIRNLPISDSLYKTLVLDSPETEIPKGVVGCIAGTTEFIFAYEVPSLGGEFTTHLAVTDQPIWQSKPSSSPSGQALFGHYCVMKLFQPAPRK